MKNRNRLLALLLVIALVAGSLAACNGNTDNTTTESTPTTAVSTTTESGGTEKIKELIVGSYMSIATLVPWKTTSDGDGYVLHQVYHTLVTMDQNSNFVSGLATDWSCAADGRTWTVNLRDDIFWQTGNLLFGEERVQVTAEDVKFSFEHSMNPDTGAVRYTDLVGTLESIEVLGPFSIQFVTKDVDVLWELKMSQTYIIPKKGVDEGWDFNAHPVGSGAYLFEEHVIDSHVTLTKNGDFWMEPGLDKVTLRIIPDRTAASVALQNKEIDIVIAVLSMEVGTIAEKDYLALAPGGVAIPRYVGYNCGLPIFQDVRMRRALAMAIDWDSATANIFANDPGVDLAFRMYGPIAPERPGANTERWKAVTPAYDPAMAQTEIEALGWTKGADGIYEKDGVKLSFTLQVGNNDANREKLAIIVSTQLKAIGVDCTTQSVEWATHLDDMSKGTLDAYVGGGWNNLDAPMWLMHSDPDNFSPNCKYSNKQVDTLLEQAWKTVDYAARSELLTQASEIFVEEAAWMGGYFEYWQTGYNVRVTDFGYAELSPPLCSEHRNISVIVN